MWFGSHFTVGVARLLLLSSRVSLLVTNLLTIRERVNLGTDHEKTYGGGVGGGVGEVPKKYSRKGKLNKKHYYR